MTTFSFAELLTEMNTTIESTQSENHTWSSVQDPAGLSFLVGSIRSKKFTSFQNSAYLRFIPFKKEPTSDTSTKDFTQNIPEQTEPEAITGYELSYEQELALAYINQILPAQLRLRGCFQINQLNKAFKKAALKTHPDCGGSHESFLKLKQSHEILVTFLSSIK